MLQPAWHGRTVNIDIGCVFGSALSALRYRELTTVSVPARAAYAPSKRYEAARADARPAVLHASPAKKR